MLAIVLSAFKVNDVCMTSDIIRMTAAVIKDCKPQSSGLCVLYFLLCCFRVIMMNECVTGKQVVGTSSHIQFAVILHGLLV